MHAFDGREPYACAYGHTGIATIRGHSNGGLAGFDTRMRGTDRPNYGSVRSSLLKGYNDNLSKHLRKALRQY
jgi:hypothetical protein